MKVLILSHNPITTFNSMGKTMLTLFSEFNKEELCQLYIYPTIPDVDKCKSYYRITDKDVLKSYFKFKVSGREILSSEIGAANGKLFENEEDTSLYRNRKNKKPFRMLARDLMWKFSGWFNKSLKQWIKREKPTHLFLAPGSAKFIYKMALKISKKYNLPIITYICDDYYFVKKARGLLGRIQQNGLKKITNKLMKRTSQIITICDSLQNTYESYFKVPAQTVMTGSNYSIADKPKLVETVSVFTYLGSIRCNRYNSLVKIGKALDDINSENGTNNVLNIYTEEQDKGILSKFEGVKSVKLCGYVSGKVFDQTFFSSEVLVHTEAFDEISIDRVKNSISTKIADSLASGICLFAFGPKEVASINYLLETSSAVCCVDENDLKEKLLQVISDKSLREKVVSNALITAKNNHDLTVVGKSVREVFDKVNNESIAN
jgi:glycosyltransferase involved in cell wall biosynthesis